ncbi:MAG TPA: TMEM175 family protein [Steroidobacteraceae bacterium]|nr:TMEM175 family protein [Steroidobacteraceae bacterium]
MSHSAPDHLLERMLFFSDAVFAIAITLLIIEVHVPELPRGSPAADYGTALAHLIPSVVGYVVSFLVIARSWITHHAAFAHSPRFDASLLWPNIQLLMIIAFMPFATAFLAKNLGAVVPTLVYNVALMIASLLSVRLVRKATALGDAGQIYGPDGLAFLRTRGLGVFFAALLALLLGLLIPVYSEMALATAPLWVRLLKRRSQARLGETRQEMVGG